MNGRGIELVEVASGYRLQVREQYSPWLGGLFSERPPRYSRALLETLALIAYRQPITRGEIEDVRGVVVSSNIIKTLMEREWIRVLGHREVPGRPALYGTTREFLDHFGLKSLEGLPPLAAIRDLDQMEPDLFAPAPASSGAGNGPNDGPCDDGDSAGNHRNSIDGDAATDPQTKPVDGESTTVISAPLVDDVVRGGGDEGEIEPHDEGQVGAVISSAASADLDLAGSLDDEQHAADQQVGLYAGEPADETRESSMVIELSPELAAEPSPDQSPDQGMQSEVAGETGDDLRGETHGGT